MDRRDLEEVVSGNRLSDSKKLIHGVESAYFMKPSASALMIAALLCGACGRSSSTGISPSNLATVDLSTLVSGVTAGASVGVSRSGLPPTPASGPRLTVTGNTTIINGGTMVADVSATTPFQTLYLAIGAKTVGLTSAVDGGIDGFYEIRLPTPQVSASVLVAFPQSIPLRQMDILFAGADPAGVVGPFQTLTTNVTSVGTGDVQVTLSWNVDSDVDLHVVDPAGEEVYWAHRGSASGGALDLDSNAGCDIDGIRNENITWPVGRAPRGTYTVRVDYWDSCGVAGTDYVVRINVGGVPQVFNGTFTGAGDGGGLGSGRLIGTFERTSGPTALRLLEGSLLNGVLALAPPNKVSALRRRQ